MIDDAKLLRTYAENHDEQAFADLVKRYVNLVYSAALRQTGGDAHLAEDIAQTVFTDLARKARSVEQGMQSGKPLVAWLYTSTRFASSHARRSEERRHTRETVAYAMNDASYVNHTITEPLWSDLKPLLDEIMSELKDEDRAAVLLRFFEGKELREVGRILGFSEEAARKRVNRALDRLRELLGSRGIRTTGAALTIALTTHAVAIAPRELAGKLVKISLASAALKAAPVVSRLALTTLMTTNLKIVISIAGGLLFLGVASHFGSGQGRFGAVDTSNSTSTVPAARSAGNPGFARERHDPPESIDPSVLAALAKIRMILQEPGRSPKYPQPEMEQAISELGAERRQAVGILRDALHHPEWEIRRRAASALKIFNEDAAEAVPDLIEMLREAPTSQDASLADQALESIGVKTDVIPDLIKVLAENPEARTLVANLIPSLVKEGSKEAAAVADQLRPLLDDPAQQVRAEAGRALSAILKGAADAGLVEKAISNLKAASQEARLSGLTMVDHLSPIATNAIPALREFLAQPNREDLKVYAEKLLARMDADFRQERESPSFKETQAEKARAFAEKARAGQATIQELVAALREYPQAIPDTARALGAIGYEGIGQRVHESSKGEQEVMSAIIRLTQIALDDDSLESRLAASDAFRQLQPAREKLIYTAQEAAPAFRVIESALNRLTGEKRAQVQTPFNGMLETQRMLWREVHKRPGEITDYRGADLEFLARELGKADRTTYNDFVAAMRTADPKFLQRP